MAPIDSLASRPFSWKTAYSAALASQLAYQGPDATRLVAVDRWGFKGCDPFDVADTQGFVAYTDRSILVAFRGSESLSDWIANMSVMPDKSYWGIVHEGFLAAYRVVHDQIVTRIAAIGPEEKTVWMTGHSLGGALAMIAAAELVHHFAVTGCYTFGQPRTVDSMGAHWLDAKFPNSLHRFVNDDDLVTRIPPGYVHAGRLIHFDDSGNLIDTLSEAMEGDAATEPRQLTSAEFKVVQEEVRRVRAVAPIQDNTGAAEKYSPTLSEGLISATMEGLIPGVSDHRLERYVAAVRRQLGSGPAEQLDTQAEMVVRAYSYTAPASEGTEATYASAAPLPVLLRLRTPQWDPPAGVQLQSRVGTFATAKATAEALEAMRNDPSIVSMEVSRETGTSDCAVSIPFIHADQVHLPPIEERGDQAIVGVVDSGIDVLHEAFLDDQGVSRIVFVWDQQDDTGPTPKQVDPENFTQEYGTFHNSIAISDMRAGQRPVPPSLRDHLEGHGTHVASIAVGRAVGVFAGGMAPEARMMVVIPHIETTPGSPPSVGYSNSHVDAIALLRAAASKAGYPIVVNVSQGMNAGAHDGSSTLESAFDALTDNGRAPGIAIVKSAGNERGEEGHAQVAIASNLVSWIEWKSLDKFRYQDYIEAWYSNFDDLEFVLIAPDGTESTPVGVDAADSGNLDLGGNTCRLVLIAPHPDNGDCRLTITIRPDATNIQEGRWRLKIIGKSVVSMSRTVDAWVERDRNRAVRFVTGDNDAMTLSIPGTARTVITVGSCGAKDPTEVSPFSSWGRTRDGRPKPDLCAPGEQVVAALANSADTQATQAQSGTSMAAPHVAGAIALVLSHRHKTPTKPQLNAVQLRAQLIKQTRFSPETHHPALGFGVLDAAKFFESLR